MVLFVDETENLKYFIVAGLIVDNQASMELAYKTFKKSLSGFNISPKYKSKVFTEFKSTLLDRDYKKIKISLLMTVRNASFLILYSIYEKVSPRIDQLTKEKIYIQNLSHIIENLKETSDIVFDGFGKADFEKDIMDAFKDDPRVLSIRPADSQTEHGLQFVDNICSTVRLHKSEMDMDNYFDIIRDIAKEV
ncbi:MAG: DUF3800 domain-containing protein [Firmicutes bacterium]|nr:DUF3800 domain-containing protein [Bacillota bacterium]